MYNVFKQEGQFDIFSREDLKVVLKHSDSLINTILINDQLHRIAPNQHPITIPLDYLSLQNPYSIINKNHFGKNNTYYLLGIFMTSVRPNSINHC